ncbi:MAG TPA: hypothetical protein VHX20_06765 [Terracidiphilus sp.]|jgi:hypothetical protein|nr:hypothetical protein [Terracidiphilus sp.]
MRERPHNPVGCKDAKFYDDLVNRVARLEIRLEKLAAEVYPGNLDELFVEPIRRRKGRKPKLETEELLRRRMNLAAWLEQNWPHFIIPFNKSDKSGDPSEALDAIVAVKQHAMHAIRQPHFYESPKAYEKELRAFFQSGRFHGNPRNLSAAMAGLPELSWKRSFDRCASHPYKTGYMTQVYRDHMRRKFTDRLRELEQAKTVAEIRTILKRSRTNDAVYLALKAQPENVKEWLDAGRPIAMSPRSKDSPLARKLHKS